MFDELHEWLQEVLPTGYQFSRGMWVDAPQVYESFICSINPAGGSAVDVDDRRPRYRLILLGPRNGRQHMPAVQDAADAIIRATIEQAEPCGAAGIRAMAEPSIGYTTENRAWAQVDLQITF